MGLITKTVTMKWNPSNRKHYELKGYNFTKMKDEFEINVNDLSHSSKEYVDVRCDGCGEILKNVQWANYINHRKNDGKYYCQGCSNRLFGRKGRNKTKIKNGSKTFYDWCYENLDKVQADTIIARWDIDKNKCSPKDVTFSSGGLNDKGYWFKCLNHPEHHSEQKNISSFTNGQEGSIKCNQCKSFGQWCLNNNRQDVLNRWNYKLNKINPFDIDYGSCGINRKGYWFKCLEHPEHKSELKNINSFTRGEFGSIDCKQCNSFAQWGYDNIDNKFLEKYWDYEENNKLKINPWEISKCSNKPKVWIKCQEHDYHESYNTQCNSFINGSRCSYCHGLKVHKLDSLGYLFPEVLKIWSNKNKKSPYDYKPFSVKEVWWKCSDDKHEDYYRKISNANICKFRCPECVQERRESFLQEKVRLYLELLSYTVLHENKCSIVPQNPKYKGSQGAMPFDNEITINNKHLLIEVHGEQHYKVDKFHYLTAKRKGTTPEHELHMQQVRDRYKRFIAYKRGYEYIVIPYWTDNAKNEWKQLIDNKIQEIINK